MCPGPYYLLQFWEELCLGTPLYSGVRKAVPPKMLIFNMPKIIIASVPFY